MAYVATLTPGLSTIAGGNVSSSFGFIQKARIEPSRSNPMLPRNGNSQFPVLSITYPAISGEIIAARAEPVFISPLAEPEKRGAISMGMAHMGPIVNSEKKKAPLRQRQPSKIMQEKNRKHADERA